MKCNIKYTVRNWGSKGTWSEELIIEYFKIVRSSAYAELQGRRKTIRQCVGRSIINGRQPHVIMELAARWQTVGNEK